MEVDENLVNQTVPNFNSSSIEPLSPLGQSSPSPETVKYQPISIQGEKGKSSWKKIIIYVFGFIGLLIILFVGGVLFSSKVLHMNPYIVMTPKVIPVGFERTGTVQSERDKEGRFYIFTYSNLKGQKFTYTLRLNTTDVQKCSPPQSQQSFISDYLDFRPKDSNDGCAMTLTDKDGDKKRVYLWGSENARFYIFAENLSISDQMAMDLADSLKPELIFVGKYINTSNTNLDF